MPTHHNTDDFMSVSVVFKSSGVKNKYKYNTIK